MSVFYSRKNQRCFLPLKYEKTLENQGFLGRQPFRLSYMVRATGLEPARRGHRFLRPTRLPFRHARMDIKYSIKKPRCQSYYRQKKPSCRFFIYRGILRRCFSEYFPDVKTNTGFFTKKRPKISTKLPKTLDSADLLWQNRLPHKVKAHKMCFCTALFSES